jgi:hypothetical protein
MQKVEGFDFFPLRFDGEGKLRSPGELDELRGHVATGVTDLIFISHGFCNDENDANRLYSAFLNTFRGQLARPELAPLNTRRIAVGGIIWPSKAFSDGSEDDEGGTQGLPNDEAERGAVAQQLRGLLDAEATPPQRQAVERAVSLLGTLEGHADTQDEIVSLLLSLAGASEAGDDEGLDPIRAQRGSDVLAKLGDPIILPTRKDDDDGGATAIADGVTSSEGGSQSIGGFFKSIAGRVGQVANVTTWYMMKNRSGTVGANGLAAVVRDLKKGQPALRVHLVGHSLGGRLMASCSKALAAAPAVQPDSLTLLEAAFSHYGFSDNNGKGKRGFFRDVVESKVVKGPMISTFSFQDTTVGRAYALSSRLADDNIKAIGDADDQFGGIGRNGTQKTAEATLEALHPPGTAYGAFTPGQVHNLDGSGGIIANHSDVKNPSVTYAFASAMAQT